MTQHVEFAHSEIIPQDYLQNLTSEKKQIIKFGADPSAPDLHLGHCVVLFQLRKCQELGHHVQFLIGDFTAKIGDPTGKSETRKPLTDDVIAQNSKTYQDQVFKILDRNKTTVYYNSEWLSKLSSTDIINLAARFNVARMLERDDFEKRYKSGQSISIHEFLYPLLQGYDSVILKNDLEIGGTDQKFNLLVGRHLQREYNVGKEQAIMTMPIIEGTDGVKKMSKSLNNHIGILDKPEDMFGKIMSIPDNLLSRYLTLLTHKSHQEITDINLAIKNNELNPRDIKVELGQYIVKFFHNQQASIAAYEHFKTVFSKKEIPTDIPEKKVVAKTKLVDWIVTENVLTSKKEAIRLINQGGISIDGEKLTDPHYLFEKNEIFIKIGKRKFFKLHL